MLSYLSEHLTSVIVGAASVLALWLTFKRPSGIPPGPGWSLPILGHALSVGADPKKPLRQWRKKYGDIFSLYLGNKLVIVINGYDALVDAFVKNGDVFSDRPHTLIFDEISQGLGVAGCSGQVWKEQRRFTLSTLRDFGMGRKIMESAIRDEVSALIEHIQGLKGEKFDFRQPVNTTVANIIFKILLGKRFDFGDAFFEELVQKIDDNFQAAGATAIVNFVPILAYLPGDLFKLKRTFKNLAFFEEEFTGPAIEEHWSTYDDDDISDFVYAYIKEIKQKEQQGLETSFHRKNLLKVIGDLFVAGSETTTTTLRYTVLLFMKYPQVQEKCFDEIKEIVGLERSIEMSDKTKLPYLEATIAEVQRFANILPLSLFHSVPQDITFRGYHFPKGVIVLQNLDSVLHDPDVFEKPEEFRPERFLDSNGKFLKVPELLPFSLGKRVCAGESLAKMELFMFLASLIQRFQFKYPDDEPPIDLQLVPGVVFSPKPYKLSAVSR